MSSHPRPESPSFLLIDDLSGAHSSVNWFTDNSTARHISISRQEIIAALFPYGAEDRLIAVPTLFLPREELDARFVLSLEPQEVFPGAEFYLEISRAVAHPAEYGRGPCHIVARQGSLSVAAQLASLKHDLNMRGLRPSVTVLDDGFAGGLTLIWLHDQLEQNGIEIEAFAVAFNRYGKSSLRDKPVIAAGTVPWGTRWMHARDLIWGAPRSGMGVLSDTLHIVGGVPYSVLRSGFSDRTGLGEVESKALRFTSILLSDEVYRRWEVERATAVTASIVCRLANIFRHPDQRVRSLLNDCARLDDEEIVALLN